MQCWAEKLDNEVQKPLRNVFQFVRISFGLKRTSAIPASGERHNIFSKMAVILLSLNEIVVFSKNINHQRAHFL